MIAVGILDDHPIIRHGPSHLLGQWPGAKVVASGATVAEMGAVEALDVVVLDLYLGTDYPALEAVAVLAAATRLSPRQEQTLGYIARGFTHEQIATRLGIRRSTVNTYVERIREKLQTGNKADLTRAALERSHQRRPPTTS